MKYPRLNALLETGFCGLVAIGLWLLTQNDLIGAIGLFATLVISTITRSWHMQQRQTEWLMHLADKLERRE